MKTCNDQRPNRSNEKFRGPNRAAGDAAGAPYGSMNMLFPLALCAAGTSSCKTSQCSAILPLATRKTSTAIMGFGLHPV